MSRSAQSFLMALLGGVLISITVSGRFTSYVKPGSGPLLLLAGAVLVVIGVLSVVDGVRSDLRDDRRAGGSVDDAVGDDLDHAPDDMHGHSHDRSRAPWLILAPILVLVILAPQALGADAVTRNAGSQALAGVTGIAPPAAVAEVAAGGAGGYPPNDGSGHGIGTKAFARHRPTIAFPPLPSGRDPSLTLREFVMRALYDGDDSASRYAITVVGFIAPPGQGYRDGYSLARLTITCCAADASPLRIHLPGKAGYPVNTWVSAVVSAVPGTAVMDNEYVPTVALTSMRPVRQPADPYEH